jgi:hypothetical protein
LPPAVTPVSADKLFKIAFSFFLGDLVEIVRPRLAARLDLAQARFLPPEQLPDFKKAGHVIPDVVAEVPTLKGESRFVVVHIDTEDSFKSKMDDRMLEYGLHLYLSTKKTVVSICVFLKGGEADVTVREVNVCVEEDDGEDSEDNWESIRFRYLSFGVGRSLAESYVDLPQPLAPALAAVMRSKVWDKVEQKLRCLRAIHRLAASLDIRRRYVLGKIVDKYLKLTDRDQKRFAAQVRQGENEEIQEMVDLWEEDLAAREARGTLKEARRAIGLLVKSCKLGVAADFEERLNANDDLDRLHRILEQVPHVRSTTELDLD